MLIRTVWLHHSYLLAKTCLFTYLTAQLIEQNMRMWKAGEEMSNFVSTLIFDGIQMTNKVELEK